MLPGKQNVWLMLTALLLSCFVQAEETYKKPELRAELLQKVAADQQARNEGNWGRVKELDHKHAKFLSDLLRDSEWPRISEVGPDGAKAAWLLVQHADHNLNLQKTVLQILESYVVEREANPQDVALLSDRIAVAENRPQQYGTQGRCIEDEGWQPNEINEPQYVHLRREKMQLAPLHLYIERMQQFCD